MVNNFLKFLAWGVACFVAVTAAAGVRTMGKEAEQFLSDMPSGLQARQEMAVREAIKGRTGLLDDVRASRNRYEDVPDDISVIKLPGGSRLYRPSDSDDSLLPVLIYLHGGGWCFGSVNSCARFCVELVREARIAVMAVEYPLAPEYPYPHALDSCVKAVSFIADNGAEFGLDAGKMSVGGDSAGGNLALATALRVGEEGVGNGVSLASVLLFYPVVKAWNDGSLSWKRYGVGYGLDGSIMEAFNEAYVADNNPENPMISPLCATDSQLAHLPPVLIVNAERDILCDQGAEMYERLVRAGVAADRMVLSETVHLFITVAGQHKAFRASVKVASEFLSGSRCIGGEK